MGTVRRTAGLEPVERLNPRQRQTILAYARGGTMRAAALELGISTQTVKNTLSEVYRRIGAVSGPQAIYLIMGGESAELQLPTRTRSGAPVPAHMPVMFDGELSLEQLEAAAAIGDHEADGSPRATLAECIDFLSYYIQPAR